MRTVTRALLAALATIVFASCATTPSPYRTGEGFKIGDITNGDNRLTFRCPHGGAVRPLLLVPKSVAGPMAASGRLTVSEGGRVVWQYHFSQDALRECSGWLNDTLSTSYRAFLFGEKTTLDEFVSPGHAYAVAVEAAGLPDGTMLYLFRLPLLYMMLP